MSDKWVKLDKQFKTSVKCEKSDFYKKMMSDIMTKSTSQWYSSLKHMTAHDQQKVQKVIIPDINHLPEEEQVERTAEHFSQIQNQYDQPKKRYTYFSYFRRKYSSIY